MTHNYLSSVLAVVALTVSLAASAVPGTGQGTAATAGGHVAQQASERVDLNSADADTLQRGLSGIGRAKAQAIVAYRNSNGNFASVEELLEVEGIGKALLDRNRDKMTIK